MLFFCILLVALDIKIEHQYNSRAHKYIHYDKYIKTLSLQIFLLI